jgi:hypothetical protein
VVKKFFDKKMRKVLTPTIERCYDKSMENVSTNEEMEMHLLFAGNEQEISQASVVKEQLIWNAAVEHIAKRLQAEIVLDSFGKNEILNLLAQCRQ